MHSLLERQLRRHCSSAAVPEAWQEFITTVDDAYLQFDADRLTLQRSLELSSQELLEANAEIRTWAEREVEQSREWYRTLIENSSDVITVLDPNGAFRYNSPSIKRVLGYDPEDLVGKSTFQLVHPDDLNVVADKVASILANQGTVELVEFRFRHKKGSWRILESAGTTHVGHEGISVVINSRDVTDRRRAEDASRENSQLFSKAFRGSPAAIAISDAQTGAFLKVNRSLLRLLGYTSKEVVGRNATELGIWLEPTDGDRFGELLRQTGSVGNFEAVFRTKSGDVIYGVISAELIELGGRSCVLSTTHDITERKQAEQTINHLAYHDPLTGLPNRTLFTDRVSTALAHARRHREALAVMFLDLDRFKLINDTLGHAVGDSLLQSIATQLRELLREEDTVARIGGDEFTILLPAIDLQHVTQVAERILESVRVPRFVAGQEIRITTSIGISQFRDDGHDTETLMRTADIAMYRAKEQGRDGYALYNESFDALAAGRLALENELRAAIDREEFVLFYQPVVNVGGGDIVALEALVRWQHPERGLVPPGDFIPVAEETGLILPLGEWVVRTACQQVKAWQDAGLPIVPVAVNLSGYRFHQCDLGAMIAQVLAEVGLDPKYLHLEITEGVVLRDIDRTVEILLGLRAIGVQISIDDFGTGYSSLAYLKRLPVDSVKIDRSFVAGLATDASDAAIATAVIAMSHSIGLNVIAEGVETEEQLLFLKQRHCDQFQGFLRAKPMPADEIKRLLIKEAVVA